MKLKVAIAGCTAALIALALGTSGCGVNPDSCTGVNRTQYVLQDPWTMLPDARQKVTMTSEERWCPPDPGSDIGSATSSDPAVAKVVEVDGRAMVIEAMSTGHAEITVEPEHSKYDELTTSVYVTDQEKVVGSRIESGCPPGQPIVAGRPFPLGVATFLENNTPVVVSDATYFIETTEPTPLAVADVPWPDQLVEARGPRFRGPSTAISTSWLRIDDIEGSHAEIRSTESDHAVTLEATPISSIKRLGVGDSSLTDGETYQKEIEGPETTLYIHPMTPGDEVCGQFDPEINNRGSGACQMRPSQEDPQAYRVTTGGADRCEFAMTYPEAREGEGLTVGFEIETR